MIAMLAGLLASGVVVPDAELLATYRARTAAVIRCQAERHGEEVMVCGRRDADRYRVPLIVSTPGDRDGEGVGDERTRLMHRTTPIQDLSPFLVGGGMAGVSVTQTFGGGAGSGGTRVEGLRPLAP